MSRSYKKFPLWKDNGPGSAWSKRVANKKVRRTFDIPNGRAYKKVYDTYNIHDYFSYYPFKKWMKREYEHYHTCFNDGVPWWRNSAYVEKYSKIPDEQEEFVEWARTYYWK